MNHPREVRRRRRTAAVGPRPQRLDETYIKVKGKWKYFYRAVDKQGNTIDFLLTANRNKKAALRFLTKAIERNGKPGLINIDKSGANTAAIQDYNHDHSKRIKIRGSVAYSTQMQTEGPPIQSTTSLTHKT